ncbi:DegT/DnrJ/EryC1/StrS family aminotransferase [Methyloceanibacter sp. wino2]|uniref:DegT/DnrJ/EryC1/StrS family aminotransferase n=1 Tax=Methyloceanibacter sp. wino2 TaxID=2170729 RepID=UPI00131EE421|nr:DegT/DnrJ/EryC1/StrS family aminotransferase [Methyloceanibacter sp. wino2]
MRDLASFDDFLSAFVSQPSFSYTTIKDGSWELLGDADARRPERVARDNWSEADRIAGRTALLEPGFVPQLIQLLEAAAIEDDPAFHIGLELSAWPYDEQILSAPFSPQRSQSILGPYSKMLSRLSDGLLLEKAVMDGRIGEFFAQLEKRRVLIVGPDNIEALRQIPALRSADFIPIHAEQARSKRDETEDEIAAWLDSDTAFGAVVLMQAGALAPYFILRLRSRYPETRWVDGGLAFSIATPRDLFSRPWGQVYRRQIARCHNRLIPGAEVPETARLDYVERIFAEVSADYAKLEPVEKDGKVSFVERKSLDFSRQAEFLESSRRYNRWANRGPLWHTLGRAYETHFRNLSGKRVVPCANGGMALTALANLHARKAGNPLRWCVSAFGFANTGRGALLDAIKIDCDGRGVLSLQALQSLDPGTFDGVILTNPFGMLEDFSPFTSWQKETGKALLVDNAAGINPNIPDIAYQSFSLHHTKPYGFGEGGLAVVPEDEAEDLLQLLEYSPMQQGAEPFWVNNGKLSENACAAHLVRLESHPEWAPLYHMQSTRIGFIAEDVGLEPLLSSHLPVMSRPFLAPHPVPIEALANDRFVLGKYYKPLTQLPQVGSIFDRLINIPSHPDMRNVDRMEIEAVLGSVLSRSKV